MEFSCGITKCPSCDRKKVLDLESFVKWSTASHTVFLFSKRHKWEMNEQRYRELKVKEDDLD